VAMLHSFWYEGSGKKTFMAVTQADPSCAMGQLGCGHEPLPPDLGENRPTLPILRKRRARPL